MSFCGRLYRVKAIISTSQWFLLKLCFDSNSLLIEQDLCQQVLRAGSMTSSHYRYEFFTEENTEGQKLSFVESQTDMTAVFVTERTVEQ
jgi:hypothetical protein